MTAIEIVLTTTALVVLVLLIMVIELQEECNVMRAEIKHLKIHVEEGKKELGGKNDKSDGFQRTC